MVSLFSFLVSRHTKQDFHFWRVNFRQRLILHLKSQSALEKQLVIVWRISRLYAKDYDSIWAEEAVSGELLSTNYSVLMKVFLVEISEKGQETEWSCSRWGTANWDFFFPDKFYSFPQLSPSVCSCSAYWDLQLYSFHLSVPEFRRFFCFHYFYHVIPATSVIPVLSTSRDFSAEWLDNMLHWEGYIAVKV